MDSFKHKYAVVTGAGSGIGRAVARQLVREGCHVAICDIQTDAMAETLELCLADNPFDVKVLGYLCDVSSEEQIKSFMQQALADFQVTYLNLLVNNAAVSGGFSFVNASREEWERTYNICWNSVYLMTRIWFPALKQSSAGHIVNISSANVIRAVLGGFVPHTAYSSAKYAVQGFSEALIHDFRYKAPHLGVSVVLPGHTGTGISSNSASVLNQNQPSDWTSDECELNRQRWVIAGNESAKNLDDQQTRLAGQQEITDMLAQGMPPEEVADTILNGIRAGQWRILIGDDTVSIDKLVRENPEAAYDPDFVYRWREEYASMQQEK
jgi:NAD(P)-dependent dehydrogenase (short-subunit alcohol dehydrogenase family)